MNLWLDRFWCANTNTEIEYLTIYITMFMRLFIGLIIYISKVFFQQVLALHRKRKEIRKYIVCANANARFPSHLIYFRFFDTMQSQRHKDHPFENYVQTARLFKNFLRNHVRMDAFCEGKI